MLTRDTLTTTTEMRGTYPTIALPEGVRSALGEDAMFVTLPIGKVGARSRNGRTYNREAVQAIVDAVNDKKPEGMWGHLRDEDRAYSYAPPAMRWLAAMIDSEGVAWAKGVPTTPEAREHFRIAKIVGSRVGTSVYGFGRMEGDEVVDFELETIDLAAPDRVGIPETAAEPMITSETDNTDEHEDDDMPENITLNDVPDDVRQRIIEQYETSNNGERISELEGANTTLREQVSTLTKERDALKAEMGALLVTHARAKIAEAVQIKPVQKLVERMVGIRESDDSATVEGISTVAELDAAIERVLDDEDVKTFNKASVAEMMGPDVQVPGSKQRGSGDGNSTLTIYPG